MKRHIPILLIISVLGLVSCKSQQKKVRSKKPDFTIIAFHTNIRHAEFDHAVPAGLSREEIRELEGIMKSRIAKYLSRHTYFRQYVAATNPAGEKLVWVNFLCENHYDPELEIFIAEFADGGDCFFQVIANLTKKDCYVYNEDTGG